MLQDSGTARPNQAALIGLLAVPQLYMILWCAIIFGSLSGAWHARIAGLDLGTAIQRAHPMEIASFFALTLIWLTGLVLVAVRRRAGVYALGTGGLLHLTIWLWVTGWQYYAGQFGLVVILTEMLGITLACFATRRPR